MHDDLVAITAKLEISGTVKEIVIPYLPDYYAYLPYDPVNRSPTKELEELIEFYRRRDLWWLGVTPTHIT